jgi:malto-oligosyltrehalose trehalohydrolase
MTTSRAKPHEGTETFAWGPQVRPHEVIFRLWAPNEHRVALELASRKRDMQEAGDGWFEYRADTGAIGSNYRFILSDGLAVPDPASRGQANDVHGPSRVFAAEEFQWRKEWLGRSWEEAIICELHIGTFTAKGTFRAAIERLPHLAAAGFTAIEVMPVAQFSGARGWGYDGVLHYAPHNAYGSPTDMKAFVDAAHQHGLMVLLDVVYNHFGPEGNYLHRYAHDFFRADRKTPWGAAINFSHPAVRRYFIDNALYWIGEFRLDGLRLDAVEQIYDELEPHILTEIAETVHAAFSGRQIHLVVEDQRNDVGLLLRGPGGKPRTYTAEWNDDFHHVAHVMATGETGGHYKAFSTEPSAKLAIALQRGFIFPNCGTDTVAPMSGAGKTVLPPSSFINFLQNHDQTGNRAFGERLLSLADAGMVKALMAILLLSPQIPFLFMGEEYGETRPFQYFCDYDGELGDIIRKGRAREAEGFGGLRSGISPKDLPDPNALNTFEHSKLDWSGPESPPGKIWQEFVRDLVQLRRAHIIPLMRRSTFEMADIEKDRDGVLALSWRFGKSRLQLRANLSNEPRRLPAFDGTVIYSFPDGESTGHGMLGAVSVVFALSAVAIAARCKGIG